MNEKPPERIWVSSDAVFDGVRTQINFSKIMHDDVEFISAVAIRELADKWEKKRELYGNGTTHSPSVFASELRKLLEGGK